jgi:hypothetical protein
MNCQWGSGRASSSGNAKRVPWRRRRSDLVSVRSQRPPTHQSLHRPGAAHLAYRQSCRTLCQPRIRRVFRPVPENNCFYLRDLSAYTRPYVDLSFRELVPTKEHR